MKRRKFVKTSATAAGLVGTMEVSPLLGASQEEIKESETPVTDNRSAEYLNLAKKNPFLPGSPVGIVDPVKPMPLQDRIKRKIVPEQGFCSITPGKNVRDTLISGNGSTTIELPGDPYSEQILFHHESLLMPWKRPLEAPVVADIFPQIRQMVLAGKTRDAVALAIQKMNESKISQDTEPHLTIPAFLMKLSLPANGTAGNYLRTLNFENSEIKVFWTDDKGDWIRKTFASRPDNVVVQLLTAPEGKTLNVDISLEKSAAWSMTSGMDWGALRGIGSVDPDMAAFVQLTADQKKLAPKGVEAGKISQEIDENNLVYKCQLDPSTDKSGYAAVTRVIRNSGSSKINKGTLKIENASSVMLLTRIEYFPEFNDAHAGALIKDLKGLSTDYSVLLERHQKVQSEMLNRVKLDLGGNFQYGLSTEELWSNQLSRHDLSPAILEKLFGMGRYWFIINSGRYPVLSAGINSTINLQNEGAVQGDLKEGMEAYFKWIEEIIPDCKTNAKNIFGFKGASFPLLPDKGIGVSFYYTPNSQIGIWPYWISAGGCLLRQFWEHFLVTGDTKFLSERLVPAYKELAMFYEDFLTVTDDDGNYIFSPSISPENTTRNTTPSGPVLINASMDIAVCREVLTILIQSCEILGTEQENVAKWQSMIAKLPPYLLETDGTLKEWAWPTLEEHYNHRHISHLYGVWPGNEIDPDRTPELAHAAKIANRRRTFDVMSTAVAGETLAAYFRCHRSLAGARLKDNVIVDTQLRQLIEQGYISTSLRCSREPYGIPIPDAQGAIPAITMEMIAYSRPGVIEILPALPETLTKGSVSGMLARSFARIDKLSWDMETKSVDLTITSLKDQQITLIARHGIEDISAPDGVLSGSAGKETANIDLHLKENEPVEINIMLGNYNPSDWCDLIL